jgi:hypothetical protein
MAVTPVVAPVIPLPLILDDAGLKISTDGTTTGLVELACVATHIELAPDTAVTTVDTMCGSTDYPGITKWNLIATLVQSFDALATEATLSAAVAHGGPVPFEVIGYKTKMVSVTNPMWSGMCNPKPYAPINGDAGAASEISLEWGVVGAPTKSTTGPYAAQAEIDLYAKTRAELDELASGLGLDPSSYANKDAEIAAIQEAQAAQTQVS